MIPALVTLLTLISFGQITKEYAVREAQERMNSDSFAKALTAQQREICLKDGCRWFVAECDVTDERKDHEEKAPAPQKQSLKKGRGIASETFDRSKFRGTVRTEIDNYEKIGFCLQAPRRLHGPDVSAKSCFFFFIFEGKCVPQVSML